MRKYVPWRPTWFHGGATCDGVIKRITLFRLRMPYSTLEIGFRNVSGRTEFLNVKIRPGRTRKGIRARGRNGTAKRYLVRARDCGCSREEAR